MEENTSRGSAGTVGSIPWSEMNEIYVYSMVTEVHDMQYLFEIKGQVAKVISTDRIIYHRLFRDSLWLLWPKS